MRKRNRIRRSVSAPYDLSLGVCINFDKDTNKLVNVPREMADLLPKDLIESYATSKIDSDLLPITAQKTKKKKRSYSRKQHKVTFELPPGEQKKLSSEKASASYSHLYTLDLYNGSALADDVRFEHTSPRDFLTDFRKLHEGAYSIIWKAKRDEEYVCVKEMKLKRSRKKFILGEVTAMLDLKSKYLVELYSAHLVGSYVHLVMEYMGGETLHSVAVHCKCSEGHIAYFAKKILKGLKFMHQEHKIHRDLKCENILLREDGVAKISDFGFTVDARELGNCEEQDLVGSPYWMAPEVIRDESYSYASDIWAFGVICRELADGQPPYVAFPWKRALHLIENQGMPALIVKRSKVFLDFLEKCNAMDPANRATADELLNHSFLKKACKKSDIVELIAEVKEAQEQDIFGMTI